MNIQLISETEIWLSQLHKEGFEISGESPDLHYGALQTFATSLAMCTFGVLSSYGQRIGAGVEHLSIAMKWTLNERPRRIEHVDMDIRWPEIPESRLDAVMRAAATCTLHRTLQHSVEVDTMIDR